MDFATPLQTSIKNALDKAFFPLESHVFETPENRGGIQVRLSAYVNISRSDVVNTKHTAELIAEALDERITATEIHKIRLEEATEKLTLQLKEANEVIKRLEEALHVKQSQNEELQQFKNYYDIEMRLRHGNTEKV